MGHAGGVGGGGGAGGVAMGGSLMGGGPMHRGPSAGSNVSGGGSVGVGGGGGAGGPRPLTSSDTIIVRNLPENCTWQGLREGFR